MQLFKFEEPESPLAHVWQAGPQEGRAGWLDPLGKAMALGEFLEALKGARKPEDLFNDEDVHPPEPTPRTSSETRSSSSTWSFERSCDPTKEGVEGSPSHSRRVTRIKEFLKEVQESPTIPKKSKVRSKWEHKQCFTG